MQHPDIHAAKAIGSAIAVLLLSLLMCMIASCAKTVYVPVESKAVSTDTTYKAVYVDRLIVERDTVNTYTKGDTVFRESIKWRVRNTESHDTAWQSKTDSIEVPKPYRVEVTREVERKLRWWEKVLMWAGAAALAIIAINLIRKLIKRGSLS